MTYDEVVELALKRPETSEALQYGKICVKRGTRFMLAPGRGPDTIAVKLDWDTHDRLTEAYPDVIFKTPHYEGWPGFLVRLDFLQPGLAEELVQAAWEDAPLPGKRRPVV